MARRAEAVERWARDGEKESPAHARGSTALYWYIALVVLIAAVFLGIMWFR
jgi:hypothetical protein